MSARRKQKPLPDLRPSTYSYPEDPDTQGQRWSVPSETRLKALAAKHGFTDLDATADRLADIFLWWRFDLKARKEPTGKVRREFLSALIERATSLNEAISKLGGTERSGIYDAAKCLPECRPDGATFDFQILQRELKLLEWASISARADVKHSPAGRPMDIPMKELCAKLWRLYSTEFGSAAKKITRNAGGFSGKFFGFAWDATRAIGIRNSNEALGKAIVIAQAKVKERASRPGPRAPTTAKFTVSDGTGEKETQLVRGERDTSRK